MHMKEENQLDEEIKSFKQNKWRYQLGIDKFPKNEDYYKGLMIRYSNCRITLSIADEYCKKAVGKNVWETKQLRDELMEKCGVTEIEATNILNGFHVEEYVIKYELMSQGIFFNVFGADSHMEHY